MFLTEQEFGTEWFYHLPCHCETEPTPLRERCPKRAWHNLLQVFTRKLTRVLSGGCALVSLLLPQHEKKKKICHRNRGNSGRMQRCFLLSLPGKAKMMVSSDGHSRPLLCTFEKTHLSIYIEKCIWINNMGLASEDSVALIKLFAQYPSILDPQSCLQIRRPRWRVTSLVQGG